MSWTCIKTLWDKWSSNSTCSDATGPGQVLIRSFNTIRAASLWNKKTLPALAPSSITSYADLKHPQDCSVFWTQNPAFSCACTYCPSLPSVTQSKCLVLPPNQVIGCFGNKYYDNMCYLNPRGKTKLMREFCKSHAQQQNFTTQAGVVMHQTCAAKVLAALFQLTVPVVNFVLQKVLGLSKKQQSSTQAVPSSTSWLTLKIENCNCCLKKLCTGNSSGLVTFENKIFNVHCKTTCLGRPELPCQTFVELLGAYNIPEHRLYLIMSDRVM